MTSILDKTNQLKIKIEVEFNNFQTSHSDPYLTSREEVIVTPCQGPDCINHGTDVCGKCKISYYCSRECQKRHWKTHKLVCKETLENIAANPQEGF